MKCRSAQISHTRNVITFDSDNMFYCRNQIKNKDDFWVWAKSGLVDGIRAGVWYNDGQPIFLRGYINDKQSRIMGYATMRQLRVKRGEHLSIDFSIT